MATEWGSILRGIGSIAGGFGLGGGGETTSPKDTAEHTWASLDAKHKFAKGRGYHPMYIMGTSANFAPATITGGGRNLGDIGRGLADVMEGVKGKSPVGKAMADLGLRQSKAQAEHAEIDTELARLELDRQRQALNAQPTKGQPAETFPYRPGLVSGKPMPMWIEVMDREGNIHHFPNPELGAEIPESVSGAMLLKGQHKKGRARPPGKRPYSGRPVHRLRRYSQ